MLRTASRIRPRLPTQTIQLVPASLARHPRTASAVAALGVGLVSALVTSSFSSSLLSSSSSRLASLSPFGSRNMSTSPVAGRTAATSPVASSSGPAFAKASSSTSSDDWAPSRLSTPSNLPYDVYRKPLEVSPLDDRSYRLLRLPNGLEALLVQDPKTDKSAAAVDVKVGHLSDPRELAGCAHFVEHMCFLGTHKYPKENDYSEFLSANGGSSNAFTGMDNTNYFFDVSPNSLQPALDRFSQFFHAPTFDPSCTERELRAVDSEHSKNLQSDMWRMFQLEKSLSRDGHEYNKFGTGNWETLREEVVKRGKDPRQEMISWWEQNYAAERMKLVVLGKDDLDTLTDWVVELFSLVQSKGLMPVSFAPDPFGPELLGTFTYQKTVKDFLAMELAWPIPDQTELYHSKPASFVAHYLGHEGPGSLLSLLKKKRWVNGLGAGASEAATGFSFFRVNLDLTPEGYENYEEVVKTVFAYLRLLAAAPTPTLAATFDECAQLASLSFQFAEKSSSPADDASDLASQLSGPWPKDWTLSQQYLMRSFNADQVRSVIDRLADVGQVKGMVAGQKLPKSMEGKTWDCKEKVYGTEYRVDRFSEELVEAAKTGSIPKELALPLPNDFIPQNLDVNKIQDVKPKEVPALVQDTALSQLWWKKDDRFWVPRANFWVSLRSPVLDASPLNAATARLFTDLFRDHVSEETYAAELAGLRMSAMYSGGHIVLSTSGYNDRLPVLMKTAIEKLKGFKIDPERFELLKDDLKRDWSNHELSESYNYANFFGYYLVEDKMYPPQEKLAVFDQITVESMTKLAQEIFSRLHITTLVHGNMEKESAVELQKVIEDVLSPETLTEAERVSDVSLFLPEASAHVWQIPLPNKVNPNSGIDYYLQIGPSTDDKLRALAALFAQVAHEPCFDNLRTKQQLGYLVSSGGRSQSGMVGFHILVQSQNDSVYLENCIESFLSETMRESLDKMTAEEFERHKQSLIDKKMQKVKNLYAESSRLWRAIGDGTFDFERRVTDSDLLKTLTKSELVAFYESYIHPQSPTRRKASVQIRTQMDPSLGPVFDPTTLEPVLKLFTTHAVPLDEAALAELVGASPSPASVQTFFRDALSKHADSISSDEAQESLTKAVDALDAGKTRERAEPVWDDRNVLVEDVKLWKSRLARTDPARPVVPLESFKE